MKKTNRNKQPVVSVITVVFNGIDTLERTIKSVINQTYRHIEYIIIDGDSIDGTHNIIKRYESCISKWISEPDDGIYDAMNKGINIATGDYFWFINSGDEIAEPDTLQKVLENQNYADVYYGDTVMVDINNQVIGNRRLTPPENLTWKDLRNGMLVSHQSIIVSRKVAKNYNTNYRFSADFEWMLLALKESSKTVNTQTVLSNFLDGGVTKKNIVPGLRERFKIMKQYFGLFSTLFYHIPIGAKFLWYYLRNKRF
jgi:glycosyltransferase involved in cell wall biosynthesis